MSAASRKKSSRPISAHSAWNECGSGRAYSPDRVKLAPRGRIKLPVNPEAGAAAAPTAASGEAVTALRNSRPTGGSATWTTWLGRVSIAGCAATIAIGLVGRGTKAGRASRGRTGWGGACVAAGGGGTIAGVAAGNDGATAAVAGAGTGRLGGIGAGTAA